LNFRILCSKAGRLSGLITVLLVLFAVSIPGMSQTRADSENANQLTNNPAIELWRDIRQRETAYRGISQVKGVDSGILINSQADKWARFRAENLVDFGFILLAVVVFLISMFYAIRGKISVKAGLSGNMLHRFGDYERVLHWVLALVFIFLAVTGLILLFGRTLLIPVLGSEIFAVLASSSKEAHNLFGPIFPVSLLLIFISFTRRNLIVKGDLIWLAKVGGMFRKSPASVGFFNMGEKIWYWLVILIGLVISVSGLILVSPAFGQGRIIMELSHLVHSISAIALLAISFGHIYLATAGTEGTSEGMKSGYVDVNWAEAHHDLWAKEYPEGGLTVSAEEFARLKGSKLPDQIYSRSTDTGEIK
jgi:formate dehydrogenase subunit gamma